MIRSNLRFRWAPVLMACTLGFAILAACGDDGAPEPAPATAGQSGASLGTQPTSTDMETSAGVDQSESTSTSETRADEPAATGTEGAAEPTAEAVVEPTAAVDPEPEPTPEPPAEQPLVEPENPAPALGSIDSWHNSGPLALDQLRGSPVLLVFWADY